MRRQGGNASGGANYASHDNLPSNGRHDHHDHDDNDEDDHNYDDDDDDDDEKDDMDYNYEAGRRARHASLYEESEDDKTAVHRSEIGCATQKKSFHSFSYRITPS